MKDKIKKSLNYSILDGAAFALMEGMSSSFIIPFAVALNASVGLIAALTYVPQLLGAFIHLFAAKIVEIIKNRKIIVVLCSFFHAVLWIPILALPYTSPDKKYLIVVYISLQAILSDLINPVWNSLMGDLVPKYERGRFFGKRNLIAGAVSFISAMAAGFILSHFSIKNLFAGFSILFFIAFIGRVLSGIFKAMMHNPPYDETTSKKFTIVDFVRRMNKTNYGHFVIYITALKFAVSIASPFFALYMLKELKFSYLQFTIMISAELIASFIAMGIWGKTIDKKGTKSVLYITGMIVPFIPILWLFSQNIHFLILVQMASGVAWAGFNLSASNFIFDAVRPENRVRCIAYFKFFEGIAIFAGALAGGAIITSAPSWIFSRVFISGIPFAFLVSGVLRLVASSVLLKNLSEARLIEVGISHTFFKKYLYIRPSEGIVYEVIGKYNRQEEELHSETVKSSKKRQTMQKSEQKKEDKGKENKGEDRKYMKNMMRFVGKNIQNTQKKKEQHDITNMEDIQHITEEIEKGKRPQK